MEFALILPVLLLLVLGTVDLGLGFRTYIALTNASRESARWVSIRPTDVAGARARAAVEADRVGLALGTIDSGGVTVSFSPNKAAYSVGERVTVNVDYRYPLMFGVIPGLSEVPFTASTTMVVLYEN